jgi:hypothetical protein
VLAARAHYPRETDFVQEARREGDRVYRLLPDGRFGGYWVEVFRL